MRGIFACGGSDRGKVVLKSGLRILIYRSKKGLVCNPYWHGRIKKAQSDPPQALLDFTDFIGYLRRELCTGTPDWLKGGRAGEKWEYAGPYIASRSRLYG